MSHILDALRQAEDERRLGQPPGRSAIASPLRAARRQGSPLLAWVVILGIIAAMAGLAWLSHPWWRPAVTPAPEKAPPTAVLAPSLPPEAGGAPAPTLTERPSPAVASDATDITEPVEDVRVRDSMPRAQLAEPDRIDTLDALFDPAGAPSDDGAEPSSADASPAPPLQPTDIFKAPETAPAAGGRPALRPEMAPEPRTQATQDQAWAELPQASSVGMPEVKINVHVYNEDPSRRFVLINGQRRKEGDSLDNGAYIERISPEGVILEWRGMRLAQPLGY